VLCDEMTASFQSAFEKVVHRYGYHARGCVEAVGIALHTRKPGPFAPGPFGPIGLSVGNVTVHGSTASIVVYRHVPDNLRRRYVMGAVRFHGHWVLNG
jgi:hypothetical protein